MAPSRILSPDCGQGISFFLLAAPLLLSSQTRPWVGDRRAIIRPHTFVARPLMERTTRNDW
jgi:hypothetical protein